MSEELRRCQTWLPRKARSCSAPALPNVPYCGNHKPPDVERRVPCPIDPSHHVLESLVVAHSKRCPTFLRIQELESMPYYRRGMNAGSDDDDDGDNDDDDNDSINMPKHEGIHQIHSHIGMAKELDEIGAGKDVYSIPEHEGPHQTHSHNGIAKELDEVSDRKDFDKDALLILEYKGVKQSHSHRGIDKELDDVTDRKGFGKGVVLTKEHNELELAHSQSGIDKELGEISKRKDFGTYVGITKLGNYLSSDLKRLCLNSLPKGKLESLVMRIESAFHTHCKDKYDLAFEQPLACSKWTGAEAGLDRRLPCQEKHAMQQASMLGNMEKFGLLSQRNGVVKAGSFRCNEEPNEQPVFIEFGAGRGYLAHMLADCYEAKKIIFIDRRPYKFKADRTLRQNADLSFERILIDIENLNLSGIQSLQGSRYIALSKHLCGSATDLTLRCCIGRRGDSSSQGSVTSFDGVAIATCCHHLCQWKSYVNKEFFRKIGFSKQDFHVLTWFTSGALSYSTNACSDDHTSNHDLLYQEQLFDLTSSTKARKFQAGLEDINEYLSQPVNRVILGLKCKQLLDTGRLYWLCQHGMDAQLVSYVPSTTTPENKLLIARSRAADSRRFGLCESRLCV